MRRSAAIALLLPALLLAGCGQDAETPAAPEATENTSSPTEETPAGTVGSQQDRDVLAAIEVSGDLGAAPTVTFTPEIVLTAPAAVVASEGEGAELVEGQTITLDFAVYGGDDVTPLGSSWADGAPTTIILGDPTYYAELNGVLAGQRIGARVILGLPGNVGATAEESYPATLMVIEVTDAKDTPEPLERAEGTAVEPAAGLPVVTLADNGEPTIEVPADAVEPTELVVQPLIQGAGAAVEAGQVVTFHYSGWLWDGTSFDSSWGKGTPFTTQIGVGSLIDGWDSGLLGQTVGSQVLLVVPSDLGYGDAGSATIPGGATLIFVVDILAAA